MPEPAKYSGRCRAPHVDSERFATWRSVLETCPEPQRTPAQQLWRLLDTYRTIGTCGELPPDVRAEYGQLFDSLRAPYRTPAFHLLWCINEIALGRDPQLARAS